MSVPELVPVLWQEAEASRLVRDRREVHDFAPDLTYVEPEFASDGTVVHHGEWVGRLPVWPFEREEPVGLADFIPKGAKVVVTYSAAHPMMPPRVYVNDPLPEIAEWSQHIWHVAPGGSLCLLQTVNDWTPETSVTELLAKASGWRIEYGLMKAGLVDTMTTCGIVTDASRDHLFAQAASE